MSYLENLRKSFTSFFRNPALLTVAILWFMLTFLLGILFDMIRMSGLYVVNRDLFTAIASASPTWFSYLNTQTYIFMGIMYAVEGFVFAYVLSFFMAGFYGMLKNLMQDGSTVFGEFFSQAKRFWYPMFRLQILRVAAGLLILALFAYSMLQLAGTTLGFLTPAQQVITTVCIILGVMLFLLLTYFLIYSESIVVLEESGAWSSIKDSARLATNRIRRTLGVFITMLLIMALGFVLVYFLSAATDIVLQPDTNNIALVIATILNYLFLLVGFAGVIVAHIFIISNYYEMSVSKSSRKVHIQTPLNAKPIRKKK